MRTMFISLILVCGLAQLASVQAATLPAKIQFDSLRSCGEIYTCFVPLSCFYLDRDNSLMDLSKATVKKAIHQDTLYENCPAVILFHLYAQHKALVIIEGLQASTDSIVFSRKARIDPKVDAQFSCERTSDPVGLIGKYSIKVDRPNPITKTTPMEYDDSSQKIRCEMKVDLIKRKYDIFKVSEEQNDRDVVQFKIKLSTDSTAKSSKAEPGEYPDRQTVRCDPDFLKGNTEKDEKKKYEKVDHNFYKPQEYSCKDDRFKMEFVKEGGTTYTESTKLWCDGNQFKVDQHAIVAGDDVNIRCAADLLLFCDVRPNVIGQNGPIFKPPTRDQISTLECSPDTPHLVVKGMDRPIKDAKFKCLAFGNEQFWTVKGNAGQDIQLKAAHPEVHCTKDLECHLYLKIEENAVKSGDLDERTYLPKCLEKGNLNVIIGTKPTPIETPYCNKTDGEYKYKEKGGTEIHTIKLTTKFECLYPEEKNDAVNKKDTAIAIGGGIGGILAAIFGGIGIVALLTFFGARRQRKAMAIQKEKERQQMAYGKKEWLNYCADKNELKQYNEDHPEVEVSVKEVEMNVWNKMLMIFQLRAMEHTGPNVTKEKIIKRKDKVRLTDETLAGNDTEYCTDFFKSSAAKTKAITRKGIDKFNAIIQYGDPETLEKDDDLGRHWEKEKDDLAEAKKPGSKDKAYRRNFTRKSF